MMCSFRQPRKSTLTGLVALVFALFAAFAMVTADEAEAANPCTPTNTYTANVVLFDTPMVFNRLGAQNPNWMMYALARDVVALDPSPSTQTRRTRGSACRASSRPTT
jgi:hypothetical protein